MVIINTPHNPTGSVFLPAALTALAELCVEKDLLVLADEVYENLTFGDAEHVHIASLPGMSKRTITVSSAAKSFNCTGWKTGWAIATPKLLDGVIKAKQFTTFVSTTPFQPAVAHALRYEQEWLDGMVDELAECRSILVEGLKQLGFHVHDTGGTYYVVADISSTGMTGVDFCMQLPVTKGVAAIPAGRLHGQP